MASPSCSLPEDQFQCSVCLDVFTDPVTIACGHNFCMDCIKKCWEKTTQCQCPMCKEKFLRRPELKVNTVFRDIVDHFKRSRGLDKPDVPCDACNGKRRRAMKSCIDCGLSYCAIHLEPHKTAEKLKKHRLINPVDNLDDWMCKKHERPLELFCRDHQVLVCQFCTETEHRTHNIVPLEKESAKRKSQVERTQTELQQMVKDRLKKMQDLRHSIVLSNKSTTKGLEFLSALRSSMKRSLSELAEVMEEKHKATEWQAKQFIKELDQEIIELKKRETELEQVSHAEDDRKLLQISESLCRPPATKNWAEIHLNGHLYVETMKRAMSELEKSFRMEMEKIPELKLRRIQEHAVDVTLDPDTAHSYLILSPDGKQVRDGNTQQDLPDNPKRFKNYCLVLGKEGFSSGKFYYEVQVSGKTEWDLGVAKGSISRKGTLTASTSDGQWTLLLRNGNEYKALEPPFSPLSLKQKPQKVGVFVDYEEGLVSFYDVDAKSHIYSFTRQYFTEKIYPMFSPCRNSGGNNSAPLVITPVCYTL
ncbi:E3 ubiquitin-protein ligase TRIM39-like [Chanos chanos]|uniref:E3 ubiquitin-protein ligase TRIM39-like n=1 Tax=Chanos chanos TaxID=29144 RepID=A0A6J2VV91_CHACN|nr:E3 ubiquitin-protein ligase TRIM39-like [Chanos chanos]